MSLPHRGQAVRLGVLRLADSAPAVIAEEQGLFRAEGVDVTLSVEPSWANIADKMAWGALDAAIMFAPLAIAAMAGLRGTRRRVITPMGISRGGNALVLDHSVTALADFAAAGDRRTTEQGAPPRLAIVHMFSTHNLLLRSLIAESGLDPDRDVELVVVPPDRVVEELAAGRIMGFCAGAPWGNRAVELGVGRLVSGSSRLRPGHGEKLLAVTAEWAEANPQPLDGLVRALRRAQFECESMCGDPQRATWLAGLLSMRLRLPLGATRASLPGGDSAERISFSDAAALDRRELVWTIAEMRRWGWLDHAFSADACIGQMLGHVAAC